MDLESKGEVYSELNNSLGELIDVLAGRYTWTSSTGKEYEIKTDKDKASSASGRIERLGKNLARLVENEDMGKSEAKEILDYTKGMFKATFGNQKFEENPFNYLRSANNAITRADKKVAIRRNMTGTLEDRNESYGSSPSIDDSNWTKSKLTLSREPISYSSESDDRKYVLENSANLEISDTLAKKIQQSYLFDERGSFSGVKGGKESIFLRENFHNPSTNVEGLSDLAVYRTPAESNLIATEKKVNVKPVVNLDRRRRIVYEEGDNSFKAPRMDFSNVYDFLMPETERYDLASGLTKTKVRKPAWINIIASTTAAIGLSVLGYEIYKTVTDSETNNSFRIDSSKVGLAENRRVMDPGEYVLFGQNLLKIDLSKMMKKR